MSTYFLSLPIIEKKEIAEHVTEVTFGLDGNSLDFEPGQYIRIVLSTLIAPDPRGSSRDFSISSLPNGKSISVAFRSPPEKISGFKKTLLSLPIGERVIVLGPHGTFTLPDSPARPFVFIAGGIGITAFASKIKYALAHRKNRVTLLWSASNEKELPYLSELRFLAEKHKERFHLIEMFGTRLSATDLSKIISESQKEKSEPLWQIAGPQEMVESVSKYLAEFAIDKTDISTEEYEGYGLAPRVRPIDLPSLSTGSLVTAIESSAPLFEGLLEALNRTAIVSKTDAEGTIIFVNDKFIEVSKYSREELIGQNHRILKSGFHPPEFYRELWQTISSGHVWRGEIKNRAKDGSYYWVDTSIAPIMGKNGMPERYVSVRFVITDKKEAEEELAIHRQHLEKLVEERTNELSTANEKLKAHATELAEADREKDEFIAVLSHELRNPLAPAISSIELIELQGADHPSTPRIVEMVHVHLKTIARLLDDLLDVTRITQKKFKLQKETIAIQTVLRRAVESVRSSAKEKNQELNLFIPEEPTWIEGDPLRLAQIFVNVLSNAVKYTNRDGIIDVRCTCEGNTLTVSVKDNGMGIPKGMLERIFGMFVQGKAHTNAVATGTGLGIGLSLTRRLLHMHGGSIRARSEGEGKGSEFIIELPVPEDVNVPPETQTSPDQEKPEKQFRILVVDDNEPAAKSLGKLLECRGHRVAIAHHWCTALSKAGDGHDIILLDIGMPEMDGYDLAKLIRSKISPLPVLIALTGYGQEDDKRRAHEAGFAYHLTKPIGLAEIEEAFKKVFE